MCGTVFAQPPSTAQPEITALADAATTRYPNWVWVVALDNAPPVLLGLPDSLRPPAPGESMGFTRGELYRRANLPEIGCDAQGKAANLPEGARTWTAALTDPRSGKRRLLLFYEFPTGAGLKREGYVLCNFP
ncbi:MAG TPA: hypothetical protein VLV83_26080 [Acidobacteriota bacterium]|nr:hypothetical protein [Acidobacteriota bacterium]